MERIRRSPVKVGSLSHYSHGFIHPRWCRISSINGRDRYNGWLISLQNWVGFHPLLFFQTKRGEMIAAQMVLSVRKVFIVSWKVLRNTDWKGLIVNQSFQIRKVWLWSTHSTLLKGFAKTINSIYLVKKDKFHPRHTSIFAAARLKDSEMKTLRH